MPSAQEILITAVIAYLVAVLVTRGKLPVPQI